MTYVLPAAKIEIDDDRLVAEGATITHTHFGYAIMGDCIGRDEEGILVVTDPDSDEITYVLDDEVEEINYGL